MYETMTDLVINKSNFSDSRWIERDTVEKYPLGEKQILVRLDRFALTANNVTYMVFGDAMQYWDFFPVQEANFGRMPVFGYATVVQSQNGAIQTGERFFGYYPLSSHLVMCPGQICSESFIDETVHRQPLFSAYNKYTRCEAEVADQIAEDTQAALKPLFITSYLAEDYFSGKKFFEATQIIVISASSKTAIAFADCCQRNDTAGMPLVGLTSKRNEDFVSSIGVYGQVIAYENLGDIDASKQTLVVDFAGNGPLVSELHKHLHGRIVHSCKIGKSHSGADYSPANFPGPKPQVFFAPTQINHRVQQWGLETFEQRLSESWLNFSGRAEHWFTVIEGTGIDAITKAYNNVLSGNTDPRSANIQSF
jgi:hypothetical protein